MRACWLKWVGRDWSISADYIWLNYSDANTKVDEYWGGEIKWVTPAEINDDSHYIGDTERHLTSAGYESANLHLMPRGTVLLTTRAPIGKVAIAVEEMCCNQGFKNLICSEAVNNEFLFRYLKSRTSELQAMGHGATFKELSKKTVAEFEIKLPALDCQLDAVNKLSAVDDQIKSAKTQLNQMDSLVKSRFNEMFGGLIPSIPISEACVEFVDGDWIESKDQSESGIRLIQTGNIGDGTFQDKENRARYISLQTFERLRCHEVFTGDVLISRLPDPVGRACIVPDNMGRSITAVDCSIVRLKKSWDPAFFVTYAMTEQYGRQIHSYLTGTTRKRISRSNLGRVKIPLVPFPLQQEFAAFVSQVDKLRFMLLTNPSPAFGGRSFCCSTNCGSCGVILDA